MMEPIEWRAIPTFPNYQISEEGQVRNKQTGKFIKITYLNGTGLVTLSHNGKPYKRTVKSLLRKIFFESPQKRNPIIYKCSVCGKVLGVGSKILHDQICIEPEKDPNIEYFTY